MSETDPQAQGEKENWQILLEEVMRLREEREGRESLPLPFYVGIAVVKVQKRLKKEPSNENDIKLLEVLEMYERQAKQDPMQAIYVNEGKIVGLTDLFGEWSDHFLNLPGIKKLIEKDFPETESE